MTHKKSGSASSGPAPRKAGGMTRRTLLKGAVAAGSVASVGPWFIRDALSTSGELTWFTWDDYEPKPFVEQFTKDTGIKLNLQIFTGNEDAINKMRASRGQGYDLVTPGLAWVSAGVDFDFYQPLDQAKVKNLGNINPEFRKRVEQLGGSRAGKMYAVPFTWSTESLTAVAEVPLEYGKASYGMLWEPQFKGKVAARARTLLLATGLWMERTGKMAPGTMLKAFDDEALMKKAYGQTLDFAIANKAQIKQFWLKGGEQKAAFLQNGCTIGMAWDSVAYGFNKDGAKFRYIAPVEGALTVMDTHCLAKGAKNIEQAYELINWTLRPPIGGLMANNVGYNSVVTGAEQYYSEGFKKFYGSAFPGNAVANLFVQGTEHPWFIAERQKMVDRLLAA
jgi:spermidine/putrescine transport system substrate-binding protein